MAPRRAAVFAAIVHHWIRTGRAPTLKEVAMATGFRHANGVLTHVRGLEADGLVTWEPTKVATLRPVVRVDRVG